MENDDSGIGPPERKRIRHQRPGEFEPERWVFKRSKVTPAGAKIYKQAEVDQLEMTTFGTLRKGEQYARVPATKGRVITQKQEMIGRGQAPASGRGPSTSQT